MATVYLRISMLAMFYIFAYLCNDCVYIHSVRAVLYIFSSEDVSGIHNNIDIVVAYNNLCCLQCNT